jgi:hypothetical protein
MARKNSEKSGFFNGFKNAALLLLFALAASSPTIKEGILYSPRTEFTSIKNRAEDRYERLYNVLKKEFSASKDGEVLARSLLDVEKCGLNGIRMAAIIAQESNFGKLNKFGGDGEIGYSQIKPESAKEALKYIKQSGLDRYCGGIFANIPYDLNEKNLFGAEINVALGTAYYQKHFNRWLERGYAPEIALDLATLSYNMGFNGALNYVSAKGIDNALKWHYVVAVKEKEERIKQKMAEK